MLNVSGGKGFHFTFKLGLMACNEMLFTPGRTISTPGKLTSPSHTTTYQQELNCGAIGVEPIPFPNYFLNVKE